MMHKGLLSLLVIVIFCKCQFMTKRMIIEKNGKTEYLSIRLVMLKT